MNETLVGTVRKSFEAKSTDELLAIWNDENRDQYADEAFEAVRRILGERGHPLQAKASSHEIAKAEKTRESGPRGDDFVCTECHAAFTRQRPLNRSFLGFVRFICPQCGKNVLYPLTNGYRAFYWVFVAAVSVLCVVMFLQGNIVLPGALVIAAIIALGRNGGIKRKVEHAWYEHDRKGQPRTVQLALTEHERATSLDPLRWFHVVFAVLLPYVAIPWGIVNLVRGKKRSGLVLLIVSIVLVATMVVIILIATRGTFAGWRFAGWRLSGRRSIAIFN